MEGLTLTTREQTRLQILNAVLERWWLVRGAAEVLWVSERHVWRILAAYRKEGAAACKSTHGFEFGGSLMLFFKLLAVGDIPNNPSDCYHTSFIILDRT